MSLDIGMIVLRIVIGLIFAVHGLQKLAGWFGGPGIRGFSGLLQQAGLRHTRAWAMLVALVETAGGLLLAAGLLTPLVAAALVANMIGAIILVHWKNGFWIAKGGYEYNLALIAASAVIGLTGGGRYSADTIFGDRYADGVPAIFALTLAVGVLAFAAEYISSRRTHAHPAPSPA
jgi:putative oxidoreductase